MSEEIWKDVVGYEGIYQVSNMGRVKSLHPGKRRYGRVLKPVQLVGGYLEVGLWRGGTGKHMLVHRLVLEAHVGPAPSLKHEGNHCNGVKDDNRVENLEWTTRLQNEKHASEHGLKACGEDNGRSKLTQDDVIEIRKLWVTGNYSQRELGRMFGVSQPTIGDIVSRKSWQDVP